MTQNDLEAASEYLALVELSLKVEDIFDAGVIYQAKFKNETRTLSKDLFLLLDKTFADIEAATDDESLILKFSDMYISRESLRTALRQAAKKLTAIVDQGKSPPDVQ